MKFKILFLYCLFLIGLSGCMSQKQLEEASKPTFDIFGVSSNYYYSHNNHWPTSIDELKSFCSKTPENCPLLDWNKYSHAHLETLSNNSLKVELYIPDDPNMPLNGKKPNLTITFHEPIKVNYRNNLDN
jgi:hypothetical protein